MPARPTSGTISRRALLGTAAAGSAALGFGHLARAQEADVAADPCVCEVGAPQEIAARQSGNIPTPREQTVVINEGTNEIYNSFNPYIPNGERAAWGIHQIAREPFFVNNLVTGELMPWLAQSYEYSPDFLSMTLRLTPGVTWSDGEAFDADDIIFTFGMLAANENLYGSGTAQTATSVTAPDPQTVVFTFAEPQPRYHNNFHTGNYSQWIRIVPQHIWEGQDPNTFTFNPPVYTGPYKLSEANAQLLMYIWQKNETYWNTQLQFAPQYVIWAQDLPVDAAVQEFQRGAIDVTPAIDYLNQQVILAEYDQAVTCDYPDPCPRAMNVNHLSRLFQFPEARQALSLLVDRDLVATTIMQPPTEAAIYPWANYAAYDIYNDDALAGQYNLTEFNPERAGQLLDSIGCTRAEGAEWRTLNGEELQLSMVTPTPAGGIEFQIAQIVAQQAQEIGLNLQFVNLQGATYTDAIDNGNYDVQCGWECDGAAPNCYGAYAVTGEDLPVAPVGERASENVERIDIPEFVPLIETFATIAEDDVANPAFGQALDLYFRTLPKVPMVQTRYSVLQNTQYWTGWPTNDDVFGPPKIDLAAWIVTLARLRPAGSQA
jgi:peptide/nickel transport system substrate-binding protein